MSSYKENLLGYIASRSGILHVQTPDEFRAEVLTSEVAQQLGYRLFVWTVTRGLFTFGDDSNDRRDLSNPVKLGEALINWSEGPAVVVLEDVVAYLNNPQLLRALKDVARKNRNAAPREFVQVLILDNKAPADGLPVIVMELEFPDREEIRGIVAKVKSVLRGKALEEVTDEYTESAIDALSGLTADQIARSLSQSLAKTKRIDLSVLASAKQDAIEDGALEWITPDPKGLAAVGGLRILKDYLGKRRKAFSKSARDPRFPRLKGIMTAGLPGTGKSLTAKAISAAWGIPLLRLDVGATFDKFVGGSEKGIRNALKVAEATAPCILWVDEIEKALAGSGGSGDSDSGTTKRVFGTILTWMQETKAQVYVVATCNDPTSLPAELFRAGRFDSVWWVGAPNQNDRKEVMMIVCARYGLEGIDTSVVAKATKDFTGAELEQAVIDAVLTADDEDRTAVTGDIVAAAKNIRPIVQGWSEIGLLKKVIDWASQAARPACDPEERKSADDLTGFQGIVDFSPTTKS